MTCPFPDKEAPEDSVLGELSHCEERIGVCITLLFDVIEG